MNDDMQMTELETVAEAYQQLLVPALFGQWTNLLADAVEVERGQKVLDVACGTGVLARTLAERVGSEGQVSAVDINPAMLAVARKGGSEVEWLEGAAEALPFGDQLFDAVTSQFGLMLFPDPKTALREMMRVLKGGGRLGVIVFDSLDHMPAYAALADVYEQVVGKGVADALRYPFSMDETALSACFGEAGIESFRITHHEGLAQFPSVRNMVLSDVRGWFPFARLHVDAQAIEEVIREAEVALVPFRVDGGGVQFPLPVQMATVTCPA